MKQKRFYAVVMHGGAKLHTVIVRAANQTEARESAVDVHRASEEELVNLLLNGAVVIESQAKFNSRDVFSRFPLVKPVDTIPVNKGET